MINQKRETGKRYNDCHALGNSTPVTVSDGAGDGSKVSLEHFNTLLRSCLIQRL